ncbi:hypothetical protein [Subtercola lobariae]|nr:hypothetical protein [Subtercola lobariae]
MESAAASRHISVCPAPGVTAEAFDADSATVASDLATLKSLLEG